MCTYLTEKVSVVGSGKGANGWFKVTDSSVYFDHPVHAPFGHSLNLDFLNPELGPSYRLALELNPATARALAQAILDVLDKIPVTKED
jgi:hypothetical protein